MKIWDVVIYYSLLCKALRLEITKGVQIEKSLEN